MRDRPQRRIQDRDLPGMIWAQLVPVSWMAATGTGLVTGRLRLLVP